MSDIKKRNQLLEDGGSAFRTGDYEQAAKAYQEVASLYKEGKLKNITPIDNYDKLYAEDVNTAKEIGSIRSKMNQLRANENKATNPKPIPKKHSDIQR